MFILTLLALSFLFLFFTDNLDFPHIAVALLAIIFTTLYDILLTLKESKK